MKQDSLTNNFIFQFLYQVVILVIPLVLSPYLTRTLGDTALGVYSYVNSIAYYFVIFAMLGISRHGQRIISENVSDDKKLGKAFWSLLSLHCFISLLSLFLYILFVLVFGNEDKLIYFIEGIYVMSALFDITWFFYGIEKFKSVVIKNTIIKLVECLLLFIFVKSKNDLWLYTLISASGIFLGQAVLWPQAIKIAKPTKFGWIDIKSHIRPLFVFFITVMAATLYTVFDKTLLGLLSSIENVAYYEYSNKIVSIPKTIISAIGTVMFPRACKMVAKGDMTGQQRYIRYSILLTSLISFGSILGLCAISEQFSILYFGDDFSSCGAIMASLSPVVYIIGIGDVLRTQYMIPNHMDKEFTISIIFNAVINLILSIVLIPILGVYGAVIGTVSAELCGLIFQSIICRHFIDFKLQLKYFLAFGFIGLVMFGIINIEKMFLNSGISSLLIQLVTGMAVFSILSIIYIVIFEKDIFNLVKKKMLKRGEKN